MDLTFFLVVFTIVTIFWGRVELQTLRYFPWVKVQNSNDTSIYELDYTSKISLTVLLQSLRNKHFLVFIITLTTLLLKVQVVLIPSLFSLKTVQVSRPVVIQTSDFFDTNFTYRIPSSENSIGYYNFKAIQDFGTGVPFGVGNNSIYQTFTQANSEKDARGTVDSPLTARVDGLLFDVECRELESCTTILKENQPKPFSKDQYVAWLQVDLKFEGCPQTVLLNITEDFYGITNTTKQWDSEVWRTANSPTNCSALPNQFPQYINLAARWSSSSTNASIPVQDACAAVICSPTAWVSKVEVLDDGDHPIMTVLPDQIKTPMHVNPYTLFESSVPNALGGSSSREARGSALKVNTYLLESTNLDAKYPDGIPHSLYSNQILHKSVLNFTQMLGPLVAHHLLRNRTDQLLNKTENQTTGSRPFDTTRLQLNQPVCISLAVISALSAFISLLAMIKYRGAFRNWDKNPATIVGLMNFLHGQRFDLTEIKPRLWNQFQGSPLPLPTWLRLIFTIYALGLVITLTIMLQISHKSDGIVTLIEGTPSLWWTVVPTLSIYLVTLYTTSSDTVVRDLAVYSRLSLRSCTMMEMNVSLLDMLGFRALYYSLRWNIYTVTLSQLLAIACGFLASFSSLLFTSANIPGNSDISLKQQSWFGNRTLAQASEPGKLSDYEIARYALGGLIISPKSSQFTWPSFTYQNLLFPRLEMDGPSKDWNSSVSFELEVPAIQLISDCAQLPQSALHLRKQRYYSQWEMTINMTRTCPNGTIVDVVGYHYPNYNTYTFSEIYARTEPCPSQYWMEKTWIWGQVFENGTYSHPSMWSCNYTWAEIPTKLQLVWTTDGFQVDHANPPQPDYSRTKLLEPSFPIDTQTFDRFDNLWPKPDLGFAVGVAETPESIDARFKYLFEPVGSLKLENIINPDDAQKTIEALNSGISLVSGQIANSLRRLDIDEASTTSPEHPGELPPFTAKVTDKRRHRLVQNAVITYLIIGVISLALIVNAWALLSSGLKRFIGYRGKWLLDLEMKDLVPSDYNSIAVSASLLSPSNYPKYVGSLDEFYTRLSGLRFRMGWFIRKGAQERELTIGVLDDPEFLFLGGKQPSK